MSPCAKQLKLLRNETVLQLQLASKSLSNEINCSGIQCMHSAVVIMHFMHVLCMLDNCFAVTINYNYDNKICKTIYYGHRCLS